MRGIVWKVWKMLYQFWYALVFLWAFAPLGFSLLYRILFLKSTYLIEWLPQKHFNESWPWRDTLKFFICVPIFFEANVCTETLQSSRNVWSVETFHGIRIVYTYLYCDYAVLSTHGSLLERLDGLKSRKSKVCSVRKTFSCIKIDAQNLQLSKIVLSCPYSS